MKVRAARPGDAEALARLRVLCWQAAYRGMIPDGYLDGLDPAEAVERWRNVLAAGEIRVTVVDDGRLAGFVSAGPVPAETPAEGAAWQVYALYVRPGLLRTGLGSRLLTAAVEGVDGPVVLWVLEVNVGARAFYVARGFDPDGGRRVESFGGVEVTELRYRRPALTLR